LSAGKSERFGEKPQIDDIELQNSEGKNIILPPLNELDVRRAEFKQTYEAVNKFKLDVAALYERRNFLIFRAGNRS